MDDNDTHADGSHYPTHELLIPVPWGHIAAKTWNDPCGLPVICLHGLQDNAGTFDRLIPLLPTAFYFVAVDLPGHGKSSHYPPGALLNFFEYVYTIRRVTDYLEWTKFICLGHSMGGQMSAFFAALFPEYVTKLILLDAITTPILPALSILRRQRKLFDNLLSFEKKLSSRTAPSYSYEEALHRLIENRNSKLTRDAAEALIKRSIVFLAGGDKCRFTSDQRLKDGLRPLMYVDQIMETVDRISAPILMVLAQETIDFFMDGLVEVKQVMNAYVSKPTFTHRIVDGNHDVHNNHPERIADILSDFLMSLKSTL